MERWKYAHLLFLDFLVAPTPYFHSFMWQALAGILNEDDGASSVEDDHKLPDNCLPNNDE